MAVGVEVDALVILSVFLRQLDLRRRFNRGNRLILDVVVLFVWRRVVAAVVGAVVQGAAYLVFSVLSNMFLKFSRSF